MDEPVIKQARFNIFFKNRARLLEWEKIIPTMDNQAQNSQRESSLEDQRPLGPKDWGKPVFAKERKPRLSLRPGGESGALKSVQSRVRVVSAIPLRDKDYGLEESLGEAKARRRNFRAVFEAGIQR